MRIVNHKILMPGAESDNRRVRLHWPGEPCIVMSESPGVCGNVPILLDRAEVVELAGVDAGAFAQSQFSSDVSSLAVGHWHWSAWLDPQGRVRHVFALLRPEPEWLLAWLPRGSATDMASALSRFVFRARLTVGARAGLDLLDAESESPAGNTLGFTEDGWTFGIGGPSGRCALLATTQPDRSVNLIRNAEWRLADVDDGLPWVAAEVMELFTPMALGLERLHAVSLGKGCYPGQEIVARLHYRGGNKRGCFRAAIADPVVPAPGTRLLSASGEAAIGWVLHAAAADATGGRALVILPIDASTPMDLKLATGAGIEILGPA